MVRAIKLFKAVAVLTFFSVLTRILGFVFRIILSNSVSTEMLGVYTIALSVFVVFATALNSGLPSTISKLVAENNVFKNNKKINNIVTSGLVINLVFCLVLVLILLVTKQLFVATLKSEIAYVLLLTMIPAIFSTALYAPFRGYLWGKENYTKVSLVEFIEQIIRILSFIVLLLFFTNSNKILSAGISLSIAGILSTILGIIFFYTSKGKLQYSKTTFKPVIVASASINGIRILSSLMQPFLSFLLPLRLVSAGFTHQQALSKLGIAMGMTMPIIMIPNTIIGSLAMAIIPKISSLVKEKKYLQVKSQINTAILFTLCCSFLILPIFMGMGKEICMFIFRSDLTASSLAGEFLINSCWIIITTGVAQLTTSILNSLGLETKGFKYYIFSNLFLLGCVYFLPKYFDVYALLYGIGISNLIVSILNIRRINLTIKNNNYYIKNLFTLLVISIPVILLVKLLFPLVNFVFPKIISLGLVSAIAGISFILLLLASGTIKLQTFKYMFNQTPKKLHAK